MILLTKNEGLHEIELAFQSSKRKSNTVELGCNNDEVNVTFVYYN